MRHPVILWEVYREIGSEIHFNRNDSFNVLLKPEYS